MAAVFRGFPQGWRYSLSRCTTRLSSYRRPCGPFEAAGLYVRNPIDTLCLADFRWLPSGRTPGSVKPLSYSVGHVFAIFVKGLSVLWLIGFHSSLRQPELAVAIAKRVSCDSLLFWSSECHAQRVFLLPDTRPSFGTQAPTLRSSRHPSDCVVAIEGIYDNNATLSRTGSHVGIGWAAAPPAAVHRPEFPALLRARRPVFFPNHVLHPYRRRFGHRQTPCGAEEACMD